MNGMRHILRLLSSGVEPPTLSALRFGLLSDATSVAQKKRGSSLHCNAARSARASVERAFFWFIKNRSAGRRHVPGTFVLISIRVFRVVALVCRGLSLSISKAVISSNRRPE